MTTALAELSRSTPKATSARNELLAQFSEPAPRAPVDVRGASRTFWACGLLAAGVAVGAWLIVLIHTMVFEPGKVGLLDRFAPPTRKALTLTLPAGKVELPVAGMSVIGYLFLVVLTTIAARLTAVVIKQGVTLLRVPANADEVPRDARAEPTAGLPPIDPVAQA